MASKNDKSNVPEENNLCVWGDNSFGQLAFDNSNNELKVFVPKMLNFGIHIVEISCGFEHSLLRSIEGELYSVGNNKKGQLGIGKKIKRRMAPTMVSFEDPKEKVLLASAQGEHNIVYTEYGNIYVWGDNSYGQLGTGDSEPREFPESITERFHLNEEESIITISCGREHSTVLLNTLKCLVWGSNEFYQLGIDAKTNENVFTPTSTMISNVKGIAAGYEQTLFLDNDGGVWVSGNNDNERLIQGKKIARIRVPTKIDFEEPVKRVFSSNMNCVITEKNNLYVWGCFMDQILPIFNPFDENESLNENQKTGNSINQNKQNASANDSQKFSHINNNNKSGIKFRIETAGIGENFFIASDEFGDCFAWGFNGNGELGQTLEKENENLTVVSFPKKLEILSPFEIKSIYTGRNFAFTIVSEKPPELEYDEGNLVEYTEDETQQNAAHVENQRRKEQMESENEESETEQTHKSVPSKMQQGKGKGKNEGKIEGHLENYHKQSENNSENNSIEEIKLNMDSHSLDVIRILIFLYENLRYHLIKVIDDHLDVDSALPSDLIDLIKRQQDIIDDYIIRCNLKVELPIMVDNENVMQLKYPDGLKLIEGEKTTHEFKVETINEQKVTNQDLLKEQMITKKIRTETLIKLTQLSSMVSERIPELKKILKIK